MKLLQASFFILALSIPSLVSAQSTGNYHIVKKIPVHSNGGWDYLAVDSENNELYVSHGTQVNILNENTGDSVGVIPNTMGVHGIALVPAVKKGYTSNGKSNSLTVFDLKTKAVITEIKAGENPDAIFYDDYSKKIFAFNGRSNDATVVDPATDEVISTIPLGGKPETGVSDGKGNVFVNIENTNEVVRINAVSLKAEARYKLSGGEDPSGLAIDRTTGRLFAGCGNKLMIVLDTKTGKTIAKLPIGDGCDGVAFDPELKLAFSSNGDGTLTVIKEVSPAKFTVANNVKTEAGARTLAIDLKTHHIFLPTAYFKENTPPGTRPKPLPGSFHILELGM